MGFSRQEYWSGVPLPSPLLILGHPNYTVLFFNQKVTSCVLLIMASGSKAEFSQSLAARFLFLFFFHDKICSPELDC